MKLMEIYVAYESVANKTGLRFSNENMQLFSSEKDAKDWVRIANRRFTESAANPHKQWVYAPFCLDSSVPYTTEVNALSHTYDIPENIVREYLYYNDNNIEDTITYIEKIIGNSSSNKIA